MSDPIWYYARGDTEQGPVPLSKLKSLLAAGRLHADDLVWTEGMEDWQPAGRIPGLLADEPPAPPGETARDTASPRQRHGSGRRTVGPRSAPSGGLLPSLGVSRAMLTAGLLLMLTSQGCEMLAGRQVGRLQSMERVARDQFQDEWDRQRIRLEDELRELREASDPSPANRSRQARINEQLAQLGEQQRGEEADLERHQWRYDRIAARDARANYLMGSYWRGWWFVWGAGLLAIGLLATARSASGAERWFCWGLLALVVYSLLIDGSVWNGPLSWHVELPSG